MTIREAQVEDLDFIVELTGKILEDMNDAFGFNKFKTKPEKRREVISERLENMDENIFYDIAVDEHDIPVGLSNYYSKNDPVGEILMILSPNDDRDVIKALYDHTIERLRGLGATSFYVQIGPRQKTFQKILQDDGFSTSMVHMVKSM